MVPPQAESDAADPSAVLPRRGKTSVHGRTCRDRTHSDHHSKRIPASTHRPGWGIPSIS